MPQKELIRETEWSREYRLGPQTVSFESKFASDGLELSAEELRKQWTHWTEIEPLDFANAFVLKPRLTTEDQLILGYLLEFGSGFVLDTLAHLLPRYSDRERALEFLLQHLASSGRCGGTYYQALESIGDLRALPALRARYEGYRRDLSPLESLTLHSPLADYQQCCRALWKLDGSSEYKTALQDLLEHPDTNIRRRSYFFLYDRWPDSPAFSLPPA